MIWEQQFSPALSLALNMSRMTAFVLWIHTSGILLQRKSMEIIPIPVLDVTNKVWLGLGHEVIKKIGMWLVIDAINLTAVELQAWVQAITLMAV